VVAEVPLAGSVVDDGSISVVLDTESGMITIEGQAPPVTAWNAPVLDLIRRGGSMWCSIAKKPGGEVVEMRVKPTTLWYRLTGEIDDADGHVAVRCTAEGEPWPA
jgi:hypothetical protein